MRSHVASVCRVVLAITIVTTSFGARLLAAGPSVVPAPEIDGGSIAAGMGLLAAGVLLLRARRRTK
jgi:hypothetical protein